MNVYTSESQTDQEFRGEESPVRVHTDAAQGISVEELCRAINVANAESEPDAIRNTIQSCVNEAQRWIGALQSIPNNHWRPRFLCAINEARKIGDTKLSVTVGVGEMAIPRLCKPRAKSPAIAAVYLMSHQANDASMPLHQDLSDSSGVIARAVVNKNDLIPCG
jgi:hypothetical protein